MDAFEDVVATILRYQGYWTTTSFKVNLTKQEKRDMGTPSSPRWEIDVLAYSGAKNELLTVECKSFLDSTGVIFRNGKFEPEKRYKLFTRSKTRKIVLSRLKRQLVAAGACAPRPSVVLGLATGKIARKTDIEGLRKHFNQKHWVLYDDTWIRERLREMANSGYENDVAHLCAKILLRGN